MAGNIPCLAYNLYEWNHEHPKNEVISVDWYIIEPFIVVVYT